MLSPVLEGQLRNCVAVSLLQAVMVQILRGRAGLVRAAGHPFAQLLWVSSGAAATRRANQEGDHADWGLEPSIGPKRKQDTALRPKPVVNEPTTTSQDPKNHSDYVRNGYYL